MSYKKIGSAVKYFMITCLFLVVVIQSLILVLPVIVSSQIKSRLPHEIRELHPDFIIEDIGITRTLLKDLCLGDDLTVDLAELRYRWKGGTAFQLEKLNVSGLSLDLVIDASGRVGFDGMVFPLENKGEISGRGKAPFTWQDLNDFFPLIPEQIRIKNSNVTLQYKQRKIRIPVDLVVDLDANRGRGNIRLSLSPLGQALDLMAVLDLKAALDQVPDKAVREIEANIRGFNPASLGPWFPDIFRDLTPAGTLDINVSRKGLGPWQYNVSGGTIRVRGLPQMGLVKFSGEVNGFRLKGTGDVAILNGGLSDSVLNCRVAAGFEPGSEPEFDLSLKSHDMDELALDLTWPGWVPESRGLPEKISIVRPRLSLDAEGTMARQNFRLNFTGESLGGGSNTGSFGLKEIFLTAGVSRLAGGPFPIDSGEVEFKAQALVSKVKGTGLTCPAVEIKAGIKPDYKNKKLSVTFDGALAGVRVVSGSSTLSMDRIGVSGRGLLDHAYPPSVSLVVVGKNAGLDTRDLGITVSGMDIHLPITYPFRPDTRPGTLEVKAVTYDKRLNAALSADLIQTRDFGITLSGKIQSREIPGLILDLALDAGADPASSDPRAEISLKSNHFVLTGDDFARLLPGTQIPGAFQMELSSDTRISVKNCALDTRGSVRVHGGSLDFPDLDLKAQGITGQIDFNDLFVPESLPGQALFVESVNAGRFRFDDGAIRFSIEDGRSLNIENLRFKWCNGLVSTESARLPAPDDRISLTLYCDRLEMDSLLRQIGAFDAKGGGTLNGRIPVVYNKGEISFDNGFLFSTPGQGGRVFVKDLDRMLEGFPKGTPEFSQLDLAGEALKDFEYEWAKLRLNTQGDTLDVRMELDGKPAGVLPFEYRKDMNSFMRVDASSPGSRFQGVKLDVNLKLPFNRVMKFGNKLKSILE